MTPTKLLMTCLILSAGMFGQTAQAQTNMPQGDLLPPVTSQSTGSDTAPLDAATHPALRLTPDKSELIRLDKEAGSVVIGNPAHISVLIDNPKLAVVVPRQGGATYFSILDKEGNVIMQRHVIVASPKKNYVRVRRSCSATSGQECRPTSVYFCPDMCHEIEAGSERR